METTLIIATGTSSKLYGPTTMVFFNIDELVAARRFERRYGTPPESVIRQKIHQHDALQFSNGNLVIIPFGVRL